MPIECRALNLPVIRLRSDRNPDHKMDCAAMSSFPSNTTALNRPANDDDRARTHARRVADAQDWCLPRGIALALTVLVSLGIWGGLFMAVRSLL
jgi:hypothetical protein